LCVSKAEDDALRGQSKDDNDADVRKTFSAACCTWVNRGYIDSCNHI